MSANVPINGSLEQKVTLLKEYPFCLMELDTTKIIFENFSRYPSLLENLVCIDDCLTVNIYSGLLKDADDASLDSLYDWLENVKAHVMAQQANGELEAQAPLVKLKGKQETYQLVFTLSMMGSHIPNFLLIQLVHDEPKFSKEERQLIRTQLDQCYRGVRFGEAFYDYSMVEVGLLMDRLVQATSDAEELHKQETHVATWLKDLKEIAIWLQLHQLVDVTQWVLERLAAYRTERKASYFQAFYCSLQTLHDLVEVGIAVAQYARYRKDIGKLRQRQTPFGMEEQKYRRLTHDFEVLRRFLETGIEQKEAVQRQFQKCYQQIIMLDNQVINYTFQRLRGIAMDLSYDLEKNLKFSIAPCAIITASHYAQHHICKFLINVLKYVIIEHLEIPKERRLAQKSVVCKFELDIVDEPEYLSFIFRDDGIRFDPEAILQRALENGLINADIAEWMRANDAANIYNLMLKPGFGPPVKPPPLTRYRPYLCMIAEETEPLQSRLSFHYEAPGFNVIRLTLPKAINGVAIGLLTEA